jgi:hypothetical protein
METKEIKVGDFVRGFKFDGTETLTYLKEMDRLIGEVGQVIYTNRTDIQVRFKDGNYIYYPKDQAIEHLCNDDMIDFEKGLDANAKDSMKALDTLVIDKTINQMLQDVENPLKETPFHKPDFSHLKDNINPEHYKSKSKETIERLQDNLTQGEFKGYLKGNILKYLDRYEHKNGVEDLNKAQWYLNKLIELES